jgi:ribosomal protein S27AE
MYMCVVFQPNHCPQCGSHSSTFTQDHRSGGYEITCGRCGRRERHEPRSDEEGIYCGYRHEASQGFGVLVYRFIGGHEFYSHSLNTVREVIDAESWLREGLRMGTVDPEAAWLTRWDDDAQRVVVLVGQMFDILAGKVVRMSGVPGEAEHCVQGDLRLTKGQCDD